MKSSRRLILISVSFASVAWGAWALFANWGQTSTELVIRTALFQAIYSGGMTVYMSYSVLFILKRTRTWSLPGLWPVLGTVGPSSLALIALHLFNQTPAFWKTISLPILVSVGYCSFLTRKTLQELTP